MWTTFKHSTDLTWIARVRKGGLRPSFRQRPLRSGSVWSIQGNSAREPSRSSHLSNRMATPAQGDTLQRPMMMGWLPPLPDFRGHLRAALAVPPSAERIEKLAFLAQHRLGFLETIQLDRALGDRTPEAASG